MSKYTYFTFSGGLHYKTLFVLTIIIVSIYSCRKDDIEKIDPIDLLVDLNLPEVPFDYENIDFPNHFLNNPLPQIPYRFQFAAIESDNTPVSNPTTNEGALLGRVLFYEKNLSKNGTIACASCHKQETGFSDTEVLSIGFNGGLTRRHSMTLTNARFYDTGKFFWDERAETLEDQVLMPIQDPVEMGLTLDELVQIVSNQPYAAPLFKEAFGDETVTADRISKALAQFVRSLVSINAKYDEGRKLVSSPLDDFPNFTAEENMGKALFYSTNLVAPSCHSCHSSEAFLSPLLAPNATTIGSINGLDAVSTVDLGIFETTGVNNHRGKFKVPSLRNVAVRAPYMHDGRFVNLEEVIEHYSTGMQNHPNTLPFMKDANGNIIKYNFTNQEKEALIAFLNTLTDNQFITDEKFSSPFK
ncbi:MAG: cytochrome c peroxidase [Bacteroidia bacterium]